MASHNSEGRRAWIFMVDSRNQEDLRDLDHLDGILWGSNPNTREGDIVLMYRTAPYSDIAYVFSATSNPRPTQPADRADTEYVIDLARKTRLSSPLTLRDIRNSPRLSAWSFAHHQQGAMRRTSDIRQEGFWPDLRRLLTARNPSLADALAGLEGVSERSRSTESRVLRPSGLGRKAGAKGLRVFLSYASPDRKRVDRLYRKLRHERNLVLWFDQKTLAPGDDWRPTIAKAIRSSDTVLICLSSHSIRRAGFAQKEIAWALEVADEQPEGTTSIIPLKLDACDLPDRLSRWQCAELFRKGGYQDLVASLRRRAAFIQEASSR